MLYEDNTTVTDNRPANLDSLKIAALAEVCKLIGRAVHLDTTLGRILQVLHETLSMERATLVMLDKNKEQLAIKSSYGLSVAEEQRGVYGLSEGVCGRIFKAACRAWCLILPGSHCF